MKFRTLAINNRIATLAVAGAVCIASQAGAATLTWANSPATGDFNIPANWDLAAIPVAGDTAIINNVNTTPGGTTVTFASGTGAVTALQLAPATAQADNYPVFEHTGGTLTIGTLALGGGTNGSSASPEYHLGGASTVLNISTGWTFGDGQAIKFIATGGTANYSGAGFNVGNNNAAHTISLSGTASLNFSMTGAMNLGQAPNSKLDLSLSGNAVFNANSSVAIQIGNAASRENTITLSNNAVFSATAATVALGQWNNGDATVPSVPGGTITVGGTSQFKSLLIKTGGNNAGNPQWGVINLNGGTIETGSITIGASSTPATSSRNVLHANGGTVKAITHASNNNYFAGIFVDIQSGGLTFNTNAVPEVIVTNVLGGNGGLTKTGTGTLTLTGMNTYTGNTVVNAGELKLNAARLHDSASVTISGTGKINLAHGGIDSVSALTFGATNGVAGTTYGSTASVAMVKNDTYFSGTGMIVVGAIAPSGRTITWTGSQSDVWTTGGPLNFVDAGNAPTDFRPGDSVIFNNNTAAVRNVTMGSVQPASVTIQGTSGWVFAGATGADTSAITGNANITSSAPTVTLGGVYSSFTGTVNVTAGTLKLGGPRSMGSSSGITVANGAQIDLNGQGPGSFPGNSYTISGAGPDGNGAIVDTTNTGLNENAGIFSLTLAANATVSSVGRFDIGGSAENQGSITGNGFTLTKKGTGGVNVRGDDTSSVIHYVIEAGRMFVENAGNFGGSTGTVLVKNGGAAGSFGPMGISTALTLESGGRLYNEGGGTAEWQGPVSVSGNVTIENNQSLASEYFLNLMEPVTGTANITKTGVGRVNVAQAPAWTGNTSVEGGMLSIEEIGLSDTGRINVSTGATLNLAFSGTDNVASLVLAGAGKIPGLWGGPNSSATNKDALLGTATGVINALADPSSIWNGNGADANWSTPQNWTSNLAPTPGALLTFAGTNKLTNNNDLAAGTTVSSLGFNAGAGSFVLNGNGITLNGPISNSSSNPQTINVPMALAGNLSLNLGTQAMTFGGAITGTGSLLKQTSTQTLTLGGNSTWQNFTVGQTVGTVGDGGRVNVNNGAAFSVGAGATNNLLVATKASEAGTSPAGQTRGILDLSAASSFTANVALLRVGHTDNGQNAAGTLNLAANNNITAATGFIISQSGSAANGVDSFATTPAASTSLVKTALFAIGNNKSRGNFTAGATSTFEIQGAGDATTRASMIVGRSGDGGGGGTLYYGKADFSGGTFRGTLSKLTIGERFLGNAGAPGHVLTGELTLGTSPTNHLDIRGNGTVLEVGKYTGTDATGSSATGTLTIGNLDDTSIIESLDNATAIVVGQSATALDGTGTLSLNGGTLTIKTTGTGINGGGATGTSTLNLNGTLLKAGANSATWITNFTNAVVGTNGAKFDTNGFAITVPQALSGTGPLVKSGTGQLTLGAITGGWGGNTTVTDGTLSMKAAILSNTGAIVIGSTGILNLDYTGSDTVKSLQVAGQGRAAGTYTAVGNNGAGEIADSRITGAGKLIVLEASTGTSGYASWVTANNLVGGDALVGADPDFDGIKNGIEFVTGGNPKVSSQAQVPTMTRDGSGNLVFVFRRTAESVPYNPFVEYSTTLQPVWVAAQHGTNGVTVAVNAGGGGAGVDLVTVTLPQALAGSGKLFARLNVVITP